MKIRRAAARLRHQARQGAIASAMWGARHLPLGERFERFLLRRTWASGSPEMLDAYLVSGYQNPRINLQSILARHFFIERLLPGAAHDLMRAEVSVAVELNEILRRRASALGVRMGAYRDPHKHAAVRRVDAAIADREHAMLDRWRALLDETHPSSVSVVELACGSANDYRAFVEAGLASHLDYLGVDLSPKNVANARRRHPEARFMVGDILDLRLEDASCDYVLASDIFEHLSLPAMDHALATAARLAREGLVLTFFNMADGIDHEVHRVRAYHWNRLSRDRVTDRLRELGFPAVTAVPVAAWLKREHGYGHSYNRHAWTLFAEREPAVAVRLPHAIHADRP